jgi:hypothetical protein
VRVLEGPSPLKKIKNVLLFPPLRDGMGQSPKDEVELSETSGECSEPALCKSWNKGPVGP